MAAAYLINFVTGFVDLFWANTVESYDPTPAFTSQANRAYEVAAYFLRSRFPRR